jgi:hypothetical protein
VEAFLGGMGRADCPGAGARARNTGRAASSPDRDLGVDLDGSAKAYPQDRVLAQAPLHDKLGGVPLVFLVGPDGRSVRAFEARVDTAAVELMRPTDAAGDEVVDVGTGSRWSFSGEARSGPLKGRRLKPIYVLKDYWFDWMTYHPRPRSTCWANPSRAEAAGAARSFRASPLPLLPVQARRLDATIRQRSRPQGRDVVHDDAAHLDPSKRLSNPPSIRG